MEWQHDPSTQAQSINQFSFSVPLNGANFQENVVGILAILKPSFIASLPDTVKPLRIREGVFAVFQKRVSQLWTRRFPMNCTISTSTFKIKMSHQLRNPLRDSSDIIISRNIIPLPFVDWNKIFGMVSRRLWDSLIHVVLESNLDHCIVNLPRSGSSLWI